MRVAIAEACGWRFHPDGSGYIPPNGNEWIGRGYKSLTDCVPDYPNDLNAMHEAEGVLFGIACENYARQLCGVGLLYYPVAHATARQRAEAFLRTIGKWRDS